jgi:Trk-type K+ transport system membrane component
MAGITHSSSIYYFVTKLITMRCFFLYIFCGIGFTIAATAQTIDADIEKGGRLYNEMRI